jgi:hypothetical protein
VARIRDQQPKGVRTRSCQPSGPSAKNNRPQHARGHWVLITSTSPAKPVLLKKEVIMVCLSHHWTLAHILSLEEGPRATTLPEATKWRQWLGTSSSHIVDKPQWRPPDHPTEVSQSSPRVKSSLSLLLRQRCRLSVEEQPHFVIPHYCKEEKILQL